MISIQKLDKLRDQARHEACPSADVTDQVMTLLYSRESTTVMLLQRPMLWCIGLASTAAVATTVLALVQYFAEEYPLLEVANSILWVAQ